MPADSNRFSFRLRDLLIGGLSIALLLSIGAPALLLTREHAREQLCTDHLRQLGLNFHYVADRDPQERFCSGAPDVLYDGSPDTWGWVADVVNHQDAEPEILLCPGNAARGTQTLRDLVEVDQLPATQSIASSRATTGLCRDNFQRTKAGSPERRALVASAMLGKNYNTNYTASWFLTRSTVKLSVTYPKMSIFNDTSDLRSLDQTRGPLSRRWAESGPIPGNRVPLLADGHAAANPLGFALENHNTSAHQRLTARTKLVAPMTGGPHHAATLEPVTVGTDITQQLQAELGGRFDALTYLQDTRQWEAVHPGEGRKTACNLLMADGSVQTLVDDNEDGLLNPGFANTSDVASTYKSDDCELPAAKVFSGLLLYRVQKSYNFEDGGGVALPPAAPVFDVAANTSRFDALPPSRFLETKDQPTSTFSIDVDTASYAYCRQVINGYQQLPVHDAVRLEEFVNYFDYDYPGPVDGRPLRLDATLADCPWQAGDRLLRVTVQAARMNAQERPPANLVFLIDVSGSMSAPNKLPLVQSSLRLLTGLLRDDDRVAIVVYAGASGIVLPPTPGSEKAVIESAVSELNAGGSTNGSEGLRTAYRLAQEHLAVGENRIILCTDGDFNVGVTDTGSITGDAEKYAAQGIYLTVLGFGGTNLNDSLLETLSNKAGGNYAFIDSEREARKVLQQQLAGTLVTVAKDVKIQLDFHPEAVEKYRLLGYENRMLERDDFHDDKKDAGEVGAGHSVTAFYQISPGKRKTGGAVAKMKLRYKLPEAAASDFVSMNVANEPLSLKHTENSFRFAAAVAAFAGKLRKDEAFDAWSYDDVSKLAQSYSDPEANGERTELLQLVRTAQRLSGK